MDNKENNFQEKNEKIANFVKVLFVIITLALVLLYFFRTEKDYLRLSFFVTEISSVILFSLIVLRLDLICVRSYTQLHNLHIVEFQIGNFFSKIFKKHINGMLMMTLMVAILSSIVSVSICLDEGSSSDLSTLFLKTIISVAIASVAVLIFGSMIFDQLLVNLEVAIGQWQEKHFS